MTPLFYLWYQGREYGPVTAEQIAASLRAGQLDGSTPVRATTQAEWYTAASVVSVFAPPPVPRPSVVGEYPAPRRKPSLYGAVPASNVPAPTVPAPAASAPPVHPTDRSSAAAMIWVATFLLGLLLMLFAFYPYSVGEPY